MGITAQSSKPSPSAPDTAVVHELLERSTHTLYVPTLITIGRTLEGLGLTPELVFERNAGGAIIGAHVVLKDADGAAS